MADPVADTYIAGRQSSPNEINKMAHSTTTRPAILTLFSTVGSILSGAYDALARIGEANAKARLVRSLSRLTDGELEARGIRREDIVRLVMADVI